MGRGARGWFWWGGGGARRVKEWMLLRGRMWVVVEGGVGERARRFVKGQAVKSVPSMVAGGLRMVVRRMLWGEWSADWGWQVGVSGMGKE